MKLNGSRFLSLALSALVFLSLLCGLCSCTSSENVNTLSTFTLSDTGPCLKNLPFGSTQADLLAAVPEAKDYTIETDENLQESLEGYYGTLPFLGRAEREDFYTGSYYDPALNADVTVSYSFADDFLGAVIFDIASRTENLSKFDQRIINAFKTQLPNYYKAAKNLDGLSFSDSLFQGHCAVRGTQSDFSCYTHFDDKIQRSVLHIELLYTK